MNLEKTEIRVFDVDAFVEPSEFEAAYRAVDALRREKVDAIKSQSAKKRSLGAGYLLVKTLSEFGVKDVSIRLGKAGKPYLEGREDVFFSLSHSGKYAVAAFRNKEIGVDVEVISDVSEKVMRRVSTDREYAYLMSLDKEKRNAEFCRLWTAKESFVKLKGEGFSISPKRLEVSLGKSLTLTNDGKCEDVVFEEYELPGYKLTACC